MFKCLMLVRQLKLNPVGLELLLMLLGVAVLLLLGVWQLERAAYKRDANVLIQQRLNADPVALGDVDELHIVGQAQAYTRVILTGHYNVEKSLLIDNAFYRGRPGFELISPFVLNDGLTVLVNRGWVPVNYDVMSFNKAGQTYSIVGAVLGGTASRFFNPVVVEDVEWPLVLHHFDFRSVDSLFENTLYPSVVVLEANELGAETVMHRGPAVPDNNSLSYAVQWFCMAFLLFVVTVLRHSNLLILIQNLRSQ